MMIIFFFSSKDRANLQFWQHLGRQTMGILKWAFCCLCILRCPDLLKPGGCPCGKLHLKALAFFDIGLLLIFFKCCFKYFSMNL